MNARPTACAVGYDYVATAVAEDLCVNLVWFDLSAEQTKIPIA